MLHFLFPKGSGTDGPDEMFAEQWKALTAAGFSTSLCSDAVLAGARPLRGLPAGSTVVYRGWMATPEEYAALVRAVEACGALPFTRPDEYLAAHYLPNWYPLLADLTPEETTAILDYAVLHHLGHHEIDLVPAHAWEVLSR